MLQGKQKLTDAEKMTKYHRKQAPVNREESAAYSVNSPHKLSFTRTCRFN